jgi:hypothetical protein
MWTAAALGCVFELLFHTQEAKPPARMPVLQGHGSRLFALALAAMYDFN